MPETEVATTQAPLATPLSTAPGPATPPDTGPRAPTTDAPKPSASSDPIAAYRAKLARPGYAYLRRFAEPVLDQLASATGGERDKLTGRLDAMFAVSHSPDGFGLTEIKQASNRYHDELGRAAIAKFRALEPGATPAASHRTAEPVARQVEREADPLLEDGVHLRVKLASVEDAELEGQVDAQISIAPNFWEWVGVALAVALLGGAIYADAHEVPAPAPAPAPRGRTALDRKGRARGAANPQAVRTAAEAAVPDAATAALGATAVVVTTPVVGGSEFSITPHGRPAFRIRINSCPLGDRVYRVVLNASKVSVLQISGAAADASIARAVAAGIAETAELVRALGANEVPGEADMLVAGGNVADGATPTARDLGAVAQPALLVDRLEATHGREQRRPVYADLHRLIDDLALRAGVAGSDRRRAAINPHLTPVARRWVVDLGAAAAALVATYARPFVEAQAEAEVDRQRDASRAQLEAPLHETPRRRARVSREAAGRLAAAARMRRRAKSERMVEKYTNLAQTAGAALHRVTDPQIGGGAALSAVRPNQLLVDDRGRWQVDESEDIAQTAAQLRWVSDAGLGDPFEFVANPNDRVPMTAVRYWEDTLATQADVINGRARVSVEAALGLVMTITPTAGGNIRLRVNGAPMVASGFPPETSPRPRAPEPATAKTNLQAALGGMGGPAVATLALLGAVDPKSDASMAQFVNTADPVILGQLRAGAAPAPAAMAVFDAAASWQLRHVPLPGGQRVLTGDEANTAQLDPASAAHWVIAGVGGTGISAAEIILDKNRAARVTMYGGTATAGLFDNVQARDVMRLYGPMGDRRFQVITSQDVGALTTNDDGATYDVGAVTGERHLTAVPGALGPWQAARRILAATDPLLLPTVRTLLQVDRAAEQTHITTRQPGPYARMLITFVGDNVPQPLRDAPDFAALLDEFGPVCGTIRLQVATGFGAVGAAGAGVSTGRLSVDGYIAAIGRRGQSSPAIQSLLADATRDGHAIAPSLLWDDDGRYIGYRITITAGANPPQHVDCVGAASRFLPMPPFQAGEQELVTRAGVADAPPESGNFDGGFAASALQAQAYARHRRDEPSRRITTLQLSGAAAPLALALGAPAATWETAVQQFLVAELRVPADTVTVTKLAGGASGDAVFRVRVGRHERIFKVFANNQAPNELAQLQYIAGLHLEEFHAVQGHVGTQAAVGANRAGVLMESAAGTSIEEMIAHLPPAGVLRNAHVDRIMRSARRVADGLAELHVATENGSQSRAQKDGPGSSAHSILNVKLPAIQAHLAPDYAAIVARFSQAVQQYVASNVPAVADHGDANAGNFIIDGDDVRVIDVGAMQSSRGPHGATGTGANDLARFITSLETLRPGALQPAEVARIRTAFLERYYEQCNARGLQVQPDDLRAAVKICRVETEIAVLNAAIRRLGPAPAAHLLQPVAASGRDRILSALQ